MAKKAQKPKEDEKKLNVNQELFCQLYIKNSELFGNGTECYGEAYGYKFDELDNSDEVIDPETKKVIQYGTLSKARNVCAVESHKQLRKPKIQARLTELLNELLKDDIVDSQLAKLIMQDYKPEAKIAAIREYNKLKQRITDKVDLTSKGKAIGNAIIFKDFKNGGSRSTTDSE